MNAYTDLNFVFDAIQYFRLVRKLNLRIPFHDCKYYLDRMIRTSLPIVAWKFYLEILDYGYP